VVELDGFQHGRDKIIGVAPISQELLRNLPRAHRMVNAILFPGRVTTPVVRVGGDPEHVLVILLPAPMSDISLSNRRVWWMPHAPP
jgi:hypothetical protein